MADVGQHLLGRRLDVDLARRDAKLVEEALRLHADEARFPVLDHVAGDAQDRTAGAAAADPTSGDCAIGTNDGLGASLCRSHRDGAYNGCNGEGFTLRLHRVDKLQNVGPCHDYSLAR